MKRKALATLVAVLCLAAIPLEPVGAWVGALRKIFSAADEATDVTRGARKVDSIEQIYPRTAGSLSSAERESLSRAYDEVKTANMLGDVRLPMSQFGHPHVQHGERTVELE